MSLTRAFVFSRLLTLPRVQLCRLVGSKRNDTATDEATTRVDTPTESDPTPTPEELQALKAENEKLIILRTELEDKYKRALAESENMRTRLMKQIDEAKIFGIQSFCKDLLEVADVLTKATESVTPEQLQPEKNPAFTNLYEGLKMTEQQMLKVFERHHLHRIIPAEGDLFDPNFHEAVFQAPIKEGKKPNTVATVTKVGYKLHNRTLRPAYVGVFGS